MPPNKSLFPALLDAAAQFVHFPMISLARLLTIGLVVAGMWPFALYAHDCPYDWNVKLAAPLKSGRVSLAEAAVLINGVVAKQTKGRIKTALTFELLPTVVTPVSDDPKLISQMESLITRYHETLKPLIAKGAHGYETCPVALNIRENFPLCCQMAGLAASVDMSFEQTERDAIFRRSPTTLECRAYKISDAMLARARQLEGKISPDFAPIPFAFATASDMRWDVFVADASRGGAIGNPILNAVTQLIPETKEILIIETPSGHQRIVETLKKDGLWPD